MDDVSASAKAGDTAFPVDSTIDARAHRRLVRTAWLTAISATLFVLSELLTIDLAVVWSIGGILQADAVWIWAVAAVGAACCLWIAARIFRTALANEIELAGFV
jgi:hypothetical protein